MWRHKVKPEIAGLAQIKGWRGETDTLEKVEWRIGYVLGSIWLDLEIIVLTVFTGFLHKNAY